MPSEPDNIAQFSHRPRTPLLTHLKRLSAHLIVCRSCSRSISLTLSAIFEGSFQILEVPAATHQIGALMQLQVSSRRENLHLGEYAMTPFSRTKISRLQGFPRDYAVVFCISKPDLSLPPSMILPDLHVGLTSKRSSRLA